MPRISGNAITQIVVIQATVSLKRAVKRLNSPSWKLGVKQDNVVLFVASPPTPA